MPNMRAVQVSRPGGPLELVERPIPEPGPGSVRIKVQACGICHSDVMTKEGALARDHVPARSGARSDRRDRRRGQGCPVALDRSASASASAGTPGTAATATPAAAATSSPARPESR